MPNDPSFADMSFAACMEPACVPARAEDPNGWCRHDHDAWRQASTQGFDAWVEAQVASSAVHVMIDQEDASR